MLLVLLVLEVMVVVLVPQVLLVLEVLLLLLMLLLPIQLDLLLVMERGQGERRVARWGWSPKAVTRWWWPRHRAQRLCSLTRAQPWPHQPAPCRPALAQLVVCDWPVVCRGWRQRFARRGGGERGGTTAGWAAPRAGGHRGGDLRIGVAVALWRGRPTTETAVADPAARSGNVATVAVESSADRAPADDAPHDAAERTTGSAVFPESALLRGGSE